MSRTMLRGGAARLVAVLVLIAGPFATAPVAATSDVCGPGGVVVGWFGDGVSCIGAGGWETFGKSNSPIAIGQTHAIAMCPDGTTWIADSGGLVSVRNGSWTHHGKAFVGGGSPDYVACADGGGVWVAGFNLLGFFDGTTVRDLGIANLGSAKYANMVKGIAVSPAGDLWVASSVSIARLTQGRWTTWMNGHGWKSKYDYYFDDIAVDARGVAWAASTSALIRFNGSTWVNLMPSKMFQPKVMAFDSSNRLWVGTYARGLWMFNGKTWTTYTTANKLASNNVTALAPDASGRLWIGTDWGLTVMAGRTWTTVRMENAALPANDVHVLAASGRGPALPAPVSKPQGRLTGRLLLNGQSQSGLTVQACAQFVGGLYSGSSPCGDQVFHREARTASDGRFTFTLPNGKYGLVYRTSAGKWVRLTDGFKIGSREMLVPAGGVFDVGDLEMSKAK